MHSPFGRLGTIVEKTGWSIHHILWGVPWKTIELMMQDAPGVKRVKVKPKKVKMSGKQYLAKRKKK